MIICSFFFSEIYGQVSYSLDSIRIYQNIDTTQLRKYLVIEKDLNCYPAEVWEIDSTTFNPNNKKAELFYKYHPNGEVKSLLYKSYFAAYDTSIFTYRVNYNDRGEEIGYEGMSRAVIASQTTFEIINPKWSKTETELDPNNRPLYTEHFESTDSLNWVSIGENIFYYSNGFLDSLYTNFFSAGFESYAYYNYDGQGNLVSHSIFYPSNGQTNYTEYFYDVNFEEQISYRNTNGNLDTTNIVTIHYLDDGKSIDTKTTERLSNTYPPFEFEQHYYTGKSVSVADINPDRMMLFPNPVESHLRIQNFNTTDKDYQYFTIFDQWAMQF